MKKLIFIISVAFSALTINAQSIQEQIKKARAKGDKGEYYGAISDYTEVIDQILSNSFNLASAYNNRGLCKFKLGDYNGAVSDYDYAILANSNTIAFFSSTEGVSGKINYVFYASRANAYMSLEKYDRAISDFTKALELNPKDLVNYYGRSVARYMMGDKNGACQDAKKAKELGLLDATQIIEKFCN